MAIYETVTKNRWPVLIKSSTSSSILAWKIPWTEEPGRLQSMGSQRVGHDWENSRTHAHIHTPAAVYRVTNSHTRLNTYDTHIHQLNTVEITWRHWYLGTFYSSHFPGKFCIVYSIFMGLPICFRLISFLLQHHLIVCKTSDCFYRITGISLGR